MISVDMNRDEFKNYLRDNFLNDKPVLLSVTGYSMEPFLRNLKDSALLVSKDFRKIRKRDIVLFERKDGKIVLHRVIRKMDGEKFLVNGDSQLWTETVELKQILAVVTEIERNGKRIRCESNLIYKFASGVWCGLKPIRGKIIAVYRFFKK